jgi:Amino acid permease
MNCPNQLFLCKVPQRPRGPLSVSLLILSNCILGWRPTFKYYNKWLSLATALACLIIMFCLDYKSAAIAVGIACKFLKFLQIKQINKNSAKQSIQSLVKAFSDKKKQEKLPNWSGLANGQSLDLTSLRPSRIDF